MNGILWGITVIAQLICLYKAINNEEVENIIFYRNMNFAFGICGICIANIPIVENIGLGSEIWLLIN